jgi:hypothetical protein
MEGDENETARFMGPAADWGQATLILHDVQPLYGGVRVELPEAGPGLAFLTRVESDGSETRYRRLLNTGQKRQLIQLCVTTDLLTTPAPERPGIPDETQVTITLRPPRRGETRMVWQWAGEMAPGFNEVYTALQNLTKPPEKLYLVRRKPGFWIQGLVWTAALLVLLLPALPAYWLGERAAALFWPARPGLALFLLLLGDGLVLGSLRQLARREQRKTRHRRVYSSLILLGLLNLAFLITLICAWEIAGAWWQAVDGAEPLLAADPRRRYVSAGYMALIAMPMQMLIAGAAGNWFLGVVDEWF